MQDYNLLSPKKKKNCINDIQTLAKSKLKA